MTSFCVIIENALLHWRSVTQNNCFVGVPGFQEEETKENETQEAVVY